MANIAQSETLYEPNKAWEYGMLFNNARSAHPPKLEAATGCSHSKAVIRTHITKYSLCMFALWCIVKCLLNIIPAYPSNPQTTSQWKHSCLPPCYDSIRSAMTGSGLATPNASKETIRFLLRVKGDHSGDSAPHFLLGTSTWIHLCIWLPPVWGVFGCQATPKPLVLLGLLWTHKKVHLSTIRNGRQPGDVGLDMVGQGFSLALHDDFKLGDPISLKVWFGFGTKTILCWWSTISIHGRLAKYCYVKCHKDTQKLLHLQKWLALQSTEMGMGQYL